MLVLIEDQWEVVDAVCADSVIAHNQRSLAQFHIPIDPYSTYLLLIICVCILFTFLLYLYYSEVLSLTGSLEQTIIYLSKKVQKNKGLSHSFISSTLN
jgi:hypothetical protein